MADIEADLAHLAEDGDEYWVNEADSLAIFASPGRFETHRLPNHLTAMVEVSDRYHITPLLRAVTFPHAAWILALSQGSVRLLEAGPSGNPEEVRVEDMPKDAMQSSGNKVVRAREAAYARKVDSALRTVLTGSDLPLILAASQPMAALYRSVNTYPHLVEEREHGNPETSTDAELADAARAILDDVYADQVAELADRFGDLSGQGRTATDVSDLARLSTYGAVDTLLVDIDASVPGSIGDDGAVTLAAEAFYGLQKLWVETTSFLASKWTRLSGDFRELGAIAQNEVTKGWVKLMAMFDERIDVDYATKIADSELNDKLAKIERETQSSMAATEKGRKEKRAAIEQERIGTLTAINDEADAAQKSRQQEYGEEIDATKAALAKAKADWQAAVAQANTKAGQQEGKAPESLADRIKKAMSGIPAALEGIRGRRIEAVGTFNVAAAYGFGSQSTQERTAKATEETARNTNRIIQRMTGGQSFA